MEQYEFSKCGFIVKEVGTKHQPAIEIYLEDKVETVKGVTIYLHARDGIDLKAVQEVASRMGDVFRSISFQRL